VACFDFEGLAGLKFRTLADRSIQISMKRRTPGEAVSRLRGGHTPELAEAARKASALMGTNGQVTRLLSEA